MTLSKRVEHLEKRTGVGRGQVILLVCHKGDDTKPSEEAFDQAVEAFIKKHEEQDIIVLYWKDGQFKEP